VKLYRYGNKRTTLRRKLGVELRKNFRRDTRGGCDRAVSGLAKLRFEATHDRNNTGSGAEMPQQEFAAGCLRKRKLSAGVNGPEVIEILIARWKAEKRRVASGLNAEKAVKRQLSDARLHVVLHLTRISSATAGGSERELAFACRSHVKARHRNGQRLAGGPG
jgi:hypothetical protein